MDSPVGRGIGRQSLAGLSAGVCVGTQPFNPTAALHPSASSDLAAQRVSAVTGPTYLAFAFHNSSCPFAKGAELFSSKRAFISSQLSSAAGSRGEISGSGSWHRQPAAARAGLEEQGEQSVPNGMP